MSDLRECHEEVSRVGSSEPCDKTAVALRIDTDGHRYPVCAYHAVRPMVALVDVIREAQAEALEEAITHIAHDDRLDLTNQSHSISVLRQRAVAYRVGEAEQ